MVSSSNLAIVGLALLAGFFVLRGNDNNNIPSSSSEIPQAFNIIQDPAQTKALPQFFENIKQKKFEQEVEIPALQKLLSDAQSLFKNTFKPFIPISNPTRAQRFQLFPRGFRQTIDPFTGLKIALPVGPRGNVKTIAFAGGQAQLDFNLRKVTEGNILKGNLSDFIADLTNQLKIKQTNTV